MASQYSLITVAAAPFGSQMSLPATRARVQISVVAGMIDVTDIRRNEAT
jgi:predicted outer membrane protein